MKITEVEIKPIKPQKGLVAFASIVIENNLYLGSIGVHTKLNSQGYRITYPNKKLGNNYIDIYHPINKQIGLKIEKAITKKAEEVLG